MRAARMLMIMVLGLAGATVVGSPAQAGGPKADETKSVTVPVRVDKQLRVTPLAGGSYSGYCVVFAFAAFNDTAGFQPTSVAYTVTGFPYTDPVGDPPYDDVLVANGFTFPTMGTQHQTLLGDGTYSQGGYVTPADAEAACTQLRNTADAQLGDTATLTLEHTEKCKVAITKLDAAKGKVKAAKKKLEQAQGPAAVAQAQAALKEAKAKLAKAKKKYKKACK